jgi:hypothetical protein
MKQTDRVILEGLRKSVLADLPQVEWDMVVKAVVDAGDVRDVQGMARTIVFDAIEKASFASRSEAGRYAANQRWKGNAGRKKEFMDLTDIDPTGSMDGNRKAELGQKYPNADMVIDLPSPTGSRTAEENAVIARNVATARAEHAKPKSTDGVDEKTAKRIKEGDLSEIARLIEKDHRNSSKNLPFGAKPYVDALKSLEHVGQNYGADSGKSIVAYALSNLTSWKGPVARAVKAELKARLKAGPPQEFVDEMQASFDAQARA